MSPNKRHNGNIQCHIYSIKFSIPLWFVLPQTSAFGERLAEHHQFGVDIHFADVRLQVVSPCKSNLYSNIYISILVELRNSGSVFHVDFLVGMNVTTMQLFVNIPHSKRSLPQFCRLDFGRTKINHTTYFENSWHMLYHPSFEQISSH